MKKCIAVIMTGILMMSLAACGKPKEYDAHKEIYKRYNGIKSYYAEGEITSKNDRSENVYHIRQFYRTPDMYSVVADSPEEIAGSGFVVKNGEVTLKSGFGKNEVLEGYLPNQKSFVCIAEFFEEYYKSEETAVAVSGGIAENTVRLDCQLNGKNVRLFRQSLWIDAKTFLPVRLETFDVNGNAVVSVKYNEFKLNCEIDDSFFE